ncbi:MAG: OmpA family protein [Bacteroidales bacterium]|nr:OmpA family protein [Bacteroidales bacterium]
MEDQKNQLNGERNELFAENEQLTVDNAEMQAKIESMESEMEEIEAWKAETQEDYDKLKAGYDELDRRYGDLKESQDALLKGHTRETKRLLTQLQKTQEDLLVKEDLLKELEENATRKMYDAERLRAQLEERNQRLVELEQILNAKEAQMKSLKDAISAALYGFEKEGLSVYSKNGMVYVSMDEKLLFKTGSIQVDPRGVQALKTMAGVLEDNPDIKITVEGHTDDVPVRTNASFADNWDLSVKRATSIVRILLDNSSIDPIRLVASGRGEFLPVDPGGTSEARQKNRRTEIILTPRLDELYQLLE